MSEKALHDATGVVRQPDLTVAGAQQRPAGVAAGRGAVRQQQLHAGAQPAQRVDQGGGGARFAERDGVDPNPAGARRIGGAVSAQALGHGVAI